MKNQIESLFRQYNIKGISCDSRTLKQNDVFFAITGIQLNGNKFIDDALKKVDLVITDTQSLAKDNVIYIKDIRSALAVGAGIIYPKLPKNLMAVTGTNGKTSVVSYIYQILQLLGKSSACMGTLGLKSTKTLPKEFLDTLTSIDQLNTPSAVDFRKILNELNSLAIDNFAFEASSHGIHQKRLGDIKMTAIGFTSFSQDHLDYHKTMEEYLRTKLQLFVDNLAEDGLVVVSSDLMQSEYGEQVREFFQRHKIHYCVVTLSPSISTSSPSLTGGSILPSYIAMDPPVKPGDDTRALGDENFLLKSINITKIVSSLTGSEISFEYQNKDYQFSTDVIGSFQASNLLMAAIMVEKLGIEFKQIFEVLHKIKAVAGRLERAGKATDEFQIFVDYSHTPESLEKALLELKKVKHKDGKLCVVFGCGGDRDPSKRSIMGQIAQNIADYVVVTDDNPRNEDPAKIRKAALKGATEAEEIADRKLAIANTIEKLKKNDILLIAGKGHENYQIIGDKILPFSDIEIARECLRGGMRIKF